jgi:hypothetical protein
VVLGGGKVYRHALALVDPVQESGRRLDADAKKGQAMDLGEDEVGGDEARGGAHGLHL